MSLHQIRLKVPTSLADDRYSLKQAIWQMFADKDGIKRPFVYYVNYQNDYSLDYVGVEVRSVTKPNTKRMSLPIIEESSVNFDVKNGDNLAFRLYASPSKRIKETGKRVSIKSRNLQMEWLIRKIKSVACLISGDVFDSYSIHVGGKKDFDIPLVGFAGVLSVLDKNALKEMYINGVGKSKVWGCGMLSLRKTCII